MVSKKATRSITVKENLRGGEGKINFDYLVDAATLGASGSMFAVATVAPGNSIGVHPHSGEFELYAFLEGEGLYNDNGAEVKVEAGDVTFCPDGECHGVKNTGDKDLVFVAFIGHPNK